MRVIKQLVIVHITVKFVAKCMVLVIQHHCSQTFSVHLGGKEDHSPVRRGAGRRPAMCFGPSESIFGNKFLVFKDRIHGNREYQVKSDRTLHVLSRDKD